MPVRRIGAAIVVAAAVGAGVVAVDQTGGGAAPAGVQTITLPANPSGVSPELGVLSRSASGVVYRTGPTDGPYRSMLLRTGSTVPEQLTAPAEWTTAAASIQGDVVVVPIGTNGPGTEGYRFTRVSGAALGTVTVASSNGERYAGAVGAGALVVKYDAGVNGGRLFLRRPAVADVELADGARVDDVTTVASDAGGALLALSDTGAPFSRSLRYLDLASKALTVLVGLAQPVQGIVFEPGRVGWIAGATLSTAPRSAPASIGTRTLPVSTAQFVSGDSLAWLARDPVLRSASRLMVRTATDPAARDVGTVAAPTPGGLGEHISSSTDVVPDGTGGFVFHVAEPAGIGLRRTVRTASSMLLTVPRDQARIRQLAISGGRVVTRDDSRVDSQVHSQQVLVQDGALRLGPATEIGRPGPVGIAARGSRTLLDQLGGPYALYGGTTQLPTSTGASQSNGTEVTGFDGTWVVVRGALDDRARLLDVRTGAVTQDAPPTDVDGGYRYYAAPSIGEVQRSPYAGGPAVTVVPADFGCPVRDLEVRQGDVLVQCRDYTSRIHGPGGGAPVLRFEDTEGRLGSGILWRTYDRGAEGTVLTATAYRTPGASPVDVLDIGEGETFAVDREGPFAAKVGPDGRVQVALAPGFPVPPEATRYVPVTPYRLLDTRATGGAVVAGADRSVPVTGVPAGVTDVAVSVTVTVPTAASWVAAYPDGRYGGSSTLNFAAGRTVSTLAVVPVRNGRIALRVGAGSAHVVLDVVGFHAGVGPTAGSGHVPVTPARLLDTRTGSPLTTAAPRAVQVSGLAGVPSNAAAVILNATVTRSSSAGWLSVSPTGSSTPTTVSYGAGQTVAALAVVPMSAGKVRLRLGGGSAHVLLDVAGYVPATTDTDWRVADYLASGPQRLLDTRTGGPVAAGADRKVQVAGVAGVPRGATAVLLTVTATRSTAASHVTAYPTGVTPTTSTLNFAAGQTTANAALVPLAADGSLSLRVGAGTSHVVLDVAGYLQR